MFLAVRRRLAAFDTIRRSRDAGGGRTTNHGRSILW